MTLLMKMLVDAYGGLESIPRQTKQMLWMKSIGDVNLDAARKLQLSEVEKEVKVMVYDPAVEIQALWMHRGHQALRVVCLADSRRLLEFREFERVERAERLKRYL